MHQINKSYNKISTFLLVFLEALAPPGPHRPASFSQSGGCLRHRGRRAGGPAHGAQLRWGGAQLRGLSAWSFWLGRQEVGEKHMIYIHIYVYIYYDKICKCSYYIPYDVYTSNCSDNQPSKQREELNDVAAAMADPRQCGRCGHLLEIEGPSLIFCVLVKSFFQETEYCFFEWTIWIMFNVMFFVPFFGWLQQLKRSIL